MASDIHDPPIAAQSTTYYTSTGGSDRPGYGVVASPCRTIQYAANLVVAGDTVLINPGTYAGGIAVETSGTASIQLLVGGTRVHLSIVLRDH